MFNEVKEVDYSQLNIYQKMLLAQSDLERVKKKLNVTTKTDKDGKPIASYKAVAYADVLDAVKPIEEKYRIYSHQIDYEIIDQQVIETEKSYGVTKQFYLRVVMTFRFVNVDKPSEYIDIKSSGVGIDTGDKADGKAITYSSKYCLLQAYKVETGDDPDQEPSEPLKSVGKMPEKNTPVKKSEPVKPVTPVEKVPDVQASDATIKELRGLLSDAESEAVMKHFEIDSLILMTEAQAQAMITRKQGKK